MNNTVNLRYLEIFRSQPVLETFLVAQSAKFEMLRFPTDSQTHSVTHV